MMMKMIPDLYVEESLDEAKEEEEEEVEAEEDI